MTWGPYVNCHPVRTPDEQEQADEQRLARRNGRRLGYVFAIALGVIGLRNCAAQGEAVSAPTVCPAPP